MSDVLAIALALIGTGGLVSAIVALSKLRVERRKLEAEREQLEAAATEQITRTALSLIEPLRRQVEELTQRVAALETELSEWKCGARLLTGQVVNLGEEPVWKPNQRK